MKDRTVFVVILVTVLSCLLGMSLLVYWIVDNLSGLRITF